MKTLIVCGGRAYRSQRRVWEVLDGINHATPIACLYEGGASGADDHARHWRLVRGVSGRSFKADWQRHGPAAGPIRNQAMLDDVRPDLVVAFPGGRGTADMVRRARAAGIEVMEVDV